MADGMLTEDMLEEWHDQLNSKCFDGVLPRCTFYIGLSRNPAVKDGNYMALYDGTYAGRGTIFINPRFVKDPETALACLAHEMIHQWQELCGLRTDHRAVFNAWCQHIHELTGLVP